MTDLSSDSYRIGAVSRLTGIPAVTLRAWERRYCAVETQREPGGSRRYSADDVERLVLIKRLVDLGNAISTVANLPRPELEKRLRADIEQVRRAGNAASDRPCRLAVAGLTLAPRLDACAALPGVELAGTHATLGELESQVRGLRADVFLLEFATLHTETIARVRRLLKRAGAARAVLVYGFARRSLIDALDDPQIVPVKAPANLAALRVICTAAMPAPHPVAGAVAEPAPAAPFDSAPDHVVPRRFSTTELNRLAAASTAIDCECPRHLSSLIGALLAFETYSVECENRTAEDAALHQYLQRVTSAARGHMEEALDRVARAEGLL